MELYLIRHGETAWDAMDARGIRGWARSFAPLTAKGRLQIETIASDFRLSTAEVIISSPYTRALESAALLSRSLNKPMFVEYDLHEWLPEKNSLAAMDDASLRLANSQFSFYAGGWRTAAGVAGEPPLPAADQRTWESTQEVCERVVRVLSRYAQYEHVILMVHAVVIASVLDMHRQVELAEIVPARFDPRTQVITGHSEPLKVAF